MGPGAQAAHSGDRTRAWLRPREREARESLKQAPVSSTEAELRVQTPECARPSWRA